MSPAHSSCGSLQSGSRQSNFIIKLKALKKIIFVSSLHENNGVRFVSQVQKKRKVKICFLFTLGVKLIAMNLFLIFGFQPRVNAGL